MKKPFLRRNIQSYVFVIALTVFGLALALILIEKGADNNLGNYLIMLSMLFTAIAMYFEIVKLNKERDEKSES